MKIINFDAIIAFSILSIILQKPDDSNVFPLATRHVLFSLESSEC